MSRYHPFPADGHQVEWASWTGDGHESTSIVWENEGFTISGQLSRERATYVVRLSATWQVRQFLLFRDLEDPDLWLATDGGGRWGEMNGAHRPELDGCYDISLAVTPFTYTLPIRRLPLLVGDAADLPVVSVDIETLGVVSTMHRYNRLTEQSWQFTNLDTGWSHEFEVDSHGLVVDCPMMFRRTGDRS